MSRCPLTLWMVPSSDEMMLIPYSVFLEAWLQIFPVPLGALTEVIQLKSLAPT